MYACRVCFNPSEKKEIEKLLNHFLIRCFSLEDGIADVRTRKIWKLYFFNNHFKKFKHDFYFSKVTKFGRMPNIPASLENNFEITIEERNWMYRNFFIDFTTIHDVWKIRFLSFFLK